MKRSSSGRWLSTRCDEPFDETDRTRSARSTPGRSGRDWSRCCVGPRWRRRRRSFAAGEGRGIGPATSSRRATSTGFSPSGLGTFRPDRPGRSFDARSTCCGRSSPARAGSAEGTDRRREPGGSAAGGRPGTWRRRRRRGRGPQPGVRGSDSRDTSSARSWKPPGWTSPRNPRVNEPRKWRAPSPRVHPRRRRRPRRRSLRGLRSRGGSPRVGESVRG